MRQAHLMLTATRTRQRDPASAQHANRVPDPPRGRRADMNSGTDQRPAGDGRDSAKGLAALRRLRPDWHIRHASDDHPGELGYRATRDLITITAPNLTRLADRIADADRGG